MENVSAFTLTLVGLGAISLYLLPALLESWGGRRRAWVVAVNATTGWTGVGWLLTLGTALAGRRTGARATTDGQLTGDSAPAHPGALIDGRLPPARAEPPPRTPARHG